MNKQQQAQMHKSEYKTRARMRKFLKRYGNREGAVVIDLPDATDTPWVTDPLMSLRDRMLIIEEADRLTGGRFSQVMTGPPHYEGQLTIEQFKGGVKATNPETGLTIIDPLDPPFPQRDYLHLLNPAAPDPKLVVELSKSFTTPQQESNEE